MPFSRQKPKSQKHRITQDFGLVFFAHFLHSFSRRISIRSSVGPLARPYRIYPSTTFNCPHPPYLIRCLPYLHHPGHLLLLAQPYPSWSVARYLPTASCSCLHHPCLRVTYLFLPALPLPVPGLLLPSRPRMPILVSPVIAVGGSYDDKSRTFL